MAVYQRLLGIFLRCHDGDGERIAAELGAGQADAARALAHRLRGSAATLGLVGVEQAAAAVEHATAATPPAQLRSHAAALRDELAAVFTRLRAVLG